MGERGCDYKIGFAYINNQINMKKKKIIKQTQKLIKEFNMDMMVNWEEVQVKTKIKYHMYI